MLFGTQCVLTQRVVWYTVFLVLFGTHCVYTQRVIWHTLFFHSVLFCTFYSFKACYFAKRVLTQPAIWHTVCSYTVCYLAQHVIWYIVHS
jgi:hypothetical protein